MRKVKKHVIKVSVNEYRGILIYAKEIKPIIEKTGFKTHQNAMDWLNNEIQQRDLSYEVMNFNKLANILDKEPKNNQVKRILEYKIEALKQEMLFTFILKESVDEKEAIKRVKQLCGHNWTTSFNKAKENTLDALLTLEYEKAHDRAKGLVQRFQNSTYEGSEAAKEVLNIINKIPGKKIVTINVEDVQQFDIDEKGIVGYDKTHYNLLLKQIDRAFNEDNSFIVRQFIPTSKEEVTLKNGKKIMMPWKALYSFVIIDDQIISIDAEEVEYAFTHDVNDNLIEMEDFIIYQDFSDFF